MEIIKGLEKDKEKINKKYQKEINDYIKDLTTNFNNIDNIVKEINNIYQDGGITIKEDINSETVINIKNKLNELPQKDIIEKYSSNLDSIISDLQTKEEIERIRKRQEEIRNAWVILNVPYISQNKNGVLNGCEAASLLMGLKYKGYLSGMSLYQYATNMPKSSNPYQGFTYDIFGLEPKNVPHWIAPGALAEFGRNSSGNPNVIDGTGMTLDQLDQEIVNGNPVVIYATAKFANTKEFIEGAPLNIHVQLLTGYNTITGEQIITDPWTYNNGRTKWTLSKSKLQSIYNAVGQRSVIIR